MTTNTVGNPVGGVTVAIPVTKVIENRAFRQGDEFGFTVEPSDTTVQAVESGRIRMPGNATASIAWTDGDGTDRKGGAFDAIAFHAPGVYTFEVREIEGDIAGIIYDNTVYDVTVTVSDDPNGHLIAGVAVAVDGEPAESGVVFTNVQELPEPPDPPEPEPSEPVGPGEPSEPGEPVEPDPPTEPSEPSEPDEPTDSAEPDEPSGSGQPSDPNEEGDGSAAGRPGRQMAQTGSRIALVASASVLSLAAAVGAVTLRRCRRGDG